MRKKSFFLVLFLFVKTAHSQLKLKDALKIAAENNLYFRSQALNKNIASSELENARLYRNPLFNLQYLQLLPSSSFYTQERGPLHALNSQDWFQVTKKFQVFGQRTGRIALASLNADVAANEANETGRELSKQVADKWIDAWKALAYQNLAVKAADYLDEYTRNSRDTFSGRSMRPEEKLRYEILDDQYDLQLAKARLDYITTISELKILLGTKDTIGIDLRDTIGTDFFYHNPDSLFEIARHTRADIRVQLNRRDQSLRNIRFQKSLAIPEPEAGFIWNPQNTIPYAGIYFTQQLPVFDRNQKQVQIARLRARQEEMMLDKKTEELRTEISTAILRYLRSGEILKNFRHNLGDSEKLLRLVKQAYLNNKTSIVDIWEAEQTWLQTRTIYYDAYVDHYKSYINLLYCLNMLE